jgi:hypothetical protein
MLKENTLWKETRLFIDDAPVGSLDVWNERFFQKGLFTKDVFLEEGSGVKKFVVCMVAEKTNKEKRLGGMVGPLNTNVARRLLWTAPK